MLSQAMSYATPKWGLLGFLCTWFAVAAIMILWKPSSTAHGCGISDTKYQVIDINSGCDDWVPFDDTASYGSAPTPFGSIMKALGIRWPSGGSIWKKIVYVVMFLPNFVLRFFLLISRGIALIPLYGCKLVGLTGEGTGPTLARKTAVLGTGYSAAAAMTAGSGWGIYKWISSFFKPAPAPTRSDVSSKWQSAGKTGKVGVGLAALAATCGVAYGAHKVAKKFDLYDKFPLPEGVRQKLKGTTDTATSPTSTTSSGDTTKTSGSERTGADPSKGEDTPWLKYASIAGVVLGVLVGLLYYFCSGSSEEEEEDGAVGAYEE